MNTKENKLYTGTATNATSRLVEHVTNKKGGEMVELIELATLIEKLNIEIENIGKDIENTLDINDKNEKIVVYNKAIDELEKAHKIQAQRTKKSWNHILPIKKEIQKTAQVKETADKSNNITTKEITENNTVPNPNKNIEEKISYNVEGKPESQIVNNKNMRGEPNTVIDGNVVEENIIDGDKGMAGHETKELDQVIQNATEGVAPVNEDEFMEQLATQMEMMFEIDKKIAEIKQENLELEKFIAEQEEIEKERVLKEEAIKVIKQAKKAKLKRDDPKLGIFNKRWIEEVYGKEK